MLDYQVKFGTAHGLAMGITEDQEAPGIFVAEGPFSIIEYYIAQRVSTYHPYGHVGVTGISCDVWALIANDLDEAAVQFGRATCPSETPLGAVAAGTHNLDLLRRDLEENFAEVRDAVVGMIAATVCEIRRMCERSPQLYVLGI